MMRSWLILIMLFSAPHFALAGNKFIRAADYGEAWPFTVSEGELRCQSLGRVRTGIVSFKTPDGREYAVNGIAKSYYLDTFLIWRDAPNGPGPKVSITKVLNDGLALC